MVELVEALSKSRLALSNTQRASYDAHLSIRNLKFNYKKLLEKQEKLRRHITSLEEMIDG